MGESVGFSNIQFQTSLTEGIWAMYRNRKCTDIVFDCKGTRVHAHRLVVSIVAPEIEELLVDSTLELDVDVDIFRSLIEYIYKGRTSVRKDQLDKIKSGAEKIRLKSLADSIDLYIGLVSETDENETNLEEVSKDAEPKEIIDCDNEVEVLADSQQNKIETDEMKSGGDVWSHGSSPSGTEDNKADTDDEIQYISSNPAKELFKIKCVHCDFESNGRDYYLKHLLLEHSSNSKATESSAKLKCVECDFVGDSRSAVLQHRRTEHNKKNLCFECDFVGDSRVAVVQHRRAQHGTKKYKKKERHFKCPDCDFVSNKHILLGRHIQNKHSTDRPFACTLCDYKSKNSSDLGKHLRYHSEHKFECTICGKLLKTQTILNGHLKLHTVPEEAKQKPHVCQFCDYRSSRRDGLVNHLKRMHDFEPPKKVQEEIPKKRKTKETVPVNEDDFECQYCEYKTNKQTLFFNHLAEKHEVDKDGNHLEPKHQCMSCDFKGFTTRHLGCHVQQYHKKNKFCCELCSFTTYNKTLFTYHMRSKHLDHKPFVCETCGLRCISVGQLRRHKLIHGDEKFVCPICGNSYSLRIYLRRHIRIMHDTNGPRFMCHMCVFTTRTKDSLKQHISRMHSEDKPCPRTRKNVKKKSVK